MSDQTRVPGLAIGPEGVPAHPVRRIDLDAWHDAGPEEIRRAAAAAAASTGLVVGTATTLLPDSLAPLLRALTLTLAEPGARGGRETVTVDDAATTYDELETAISQRPATAIALGQLLRQTAVLPTGSGLAAEAAVYSMLLGGPEFAAWQNGREIPPLALVEDDLVLVERDDDLLKITLDRPARRNALSFTLREELYAALELAILDETVTRVELAGAGSSFCSGGDLAEFGTATDLVAAYLVRIDRAPWRLIDELSRRPGTGVHVRVHGAAIGAGAELAAFADRVSCSTDAYFRLPEISMGLVPGAGGTVSIVGRIGRWRAAWMMLTGDTIEPATALAWGLVDQILAEQ